MSEKFDPFTFYLMLCESVDDRLRERLLRYMVQHGYIGKKHRVTRRELAIELLGKFTQRTDRMIRKSKEGLPILSSSGKSGYYLAAYQEEIDAYIQENKNRITSLQQNIHAAKKIKLPYLQPDHMKQLNFLEERL